MSSYENFLRDVDILSGCLLGEYNKEGKYIISKDIIELLVQTKKQILSYKNEIISAQTQIGTSTLKFAIEMQVSPQEELKYASLYIIEEYKFLGKTYSIKSFLVGYSDYDDVFFLEKLKQVFNLYTADDFDGKDISEIAKKIQEIKDKKKQISKGIFDNLSDFNKTYIIDVIRNLKGMGEYGILIQKLFKEKMEKLSLSKKDPKYWQELKRYLDIIILENKEKFPDQTKTICDYLEKTYVPVYNKAKDSASKPKQQEKKSVKKKSASKSNKKLDVGATKFKNLKLDWSLSNNKIKFEFDLSLLQSKNNLYNNQPNNNKSLSQNKKVDFGKDITSMGNMQQKNNSQNKPHTEEQQQNKTEIGKKLTDIKTQSDDTKKLKMDELRGNMEYFDNQNKIKSFEYEK